MKNIILVFAVMLIGTVGYSQIKVVTNGNTKIGNTAVPPISKLHVAGNVTIDAPALVMGVLGATNTKRITVSPFQNNFGASSFFTMFGDETFAGGDPSRAGEFVLAGDVVTLRVNKQEGVNFGDLGLEVKANKDLYAYTANTFKIGNTAWTTISDKRLKTGVKKYKKGLDAVLAINPVVFKYNNVLSNIDTDTEFVGVLAQEFQEVSPEDVNPVAIRDNEYETKSITTDYLGVNDASIKYMLINAIKEQQEIIEENGQIISQLESKISELETKISSLDGNHNIDPIGNGNVSNTNDAAIVDMSNRPNPFNESTIISYNLPEDATSANLVISDINGKLVKNVSINIASNTNQYEFSAKGLANGIYNYTMLINNQVVQTKQMAVLK